MSTTTYFFVGLKKNISTFWLRKKVLYIEVWCFLCRKPNRDSQFSHVEAESLLPYVYPFTLTRCRLNRLSHTIYWKSPISILGMYGYEIYIFLEKNG